MTSWTRVGVALAMVACGDSGPESAKHGAADDAPAPSEATFCKLSLTYDVGGGLMQVRLGTNLDDVIEVLGHPTTRDDDELTYSWCADFGCTKRVRAVLTFDRFDRCYLDSGKAIDQPYWLADVELDGLAEPACWKPGAEAKGRCPECIPTGQIVECE